MFTGMLWFDNSKTATLAEKIKKATDYYANKYHRTPDLVLVHPSMMGEGVNKLEIKIDKLTIRSYRPILPGHIWIGMEDLEPVDNGAEKEKEGS
jgi:hypothetical protein